jgi:hypothetical protein
MRSNGNFISPSAQRTFCTFDELLRPQIFSMLFLPIDGNPSRPRKIDVDAYALTQKAFR